MRCYEVFQTVWSHSLCGGSFFLFVFEKGQLHYFYNTLILRTNSGFKKVILIGDIRLTQHWSQIVGFLGVERWTGAEWSFKSILMYMHTLYHPHGNFSVSSTCCTNTVEIVFCIRPVFYLAAILLLTGIRLLAVPNPASSEKDLKSQYWINTQYQPPFGLIPKSVEVIWQSGLFMHSCFVFNTVLLLL